VVVATESFAALAREEAEAQGLAGARVAVVPHPLGGIKRSVLVLESRADALVDEILSLLTGGGR
jgi:hypothetical protein